MFSKVQEHISNSMLAGTIVAKDRMIKGCLDGQDQYVMVNDEDAVMIQLGTPINYGKAKKIGSFDEIIYTPKTALSQEQITSIIANNSYTNSDTDLWGLTLLKETKKLWICLGTLDGHKRIFNLKKEKYPVLPATISHKLNKKANVTLKNYMMIHYNRAVAVKEVKEAKAKLVSKGIMEVVSMKIGRKENCQVAVFKPDYGKRYNMYQKTGVIIVTIL